MKNKKQLFPVALSALLHIPVSILSKYREGRRRTRYGCQSYCVLAGRPQQPHEKHDNTSLAHENKQVRLTGLSTGLGDTSSVFTMRTTPPHQEMSNYFTHNHTSFKALMGKHTPPFLIFLVIFNLPLLIFIFTCNVRLTRRAYKFSPRQRRRASRGRVEPIVSAFFVFCLSA